MRLSGGSWELSTPPKKTPTIAPLKIRCIFLKKTVKSLVFEEEKQIEHKILSTSINTYSMNISVRKSIESTILLVAPSPSLTESFFFFWFCQSIYFLSAHPYESTSSSDGYGVHHRRRPSVHVILTKSATGNIRTIFGQTFWYPCSGMCGSID